MNSESLQRQFEVMADAPNGMERLRELILELAVRGKLVPQDTREEPASALIGERASGQGSVTRRDVDEGDLPFSTPAGWVWLRLREAGRFMGGGTPSKAESSFWDGDIPWVSPKDMKRLRISDSADHISAEAVARSAVRLIPRGALLMVVRGMILARAFPVAVTTCEVTVNQDMKALHLYDPRIAEFMLLALRAWRSRVLLRVERSTHGTCRLDSAVLEELLLPLPPLAEQRRVIAKVDELMALCDELEDRQQRRADVRTRLNLSVLHHLTAAADDAVLAAQWQRLRENFGLLYDTPETVAELRSAVLQLAVRGKLVAQESSEETATVTLERITAEKQRMLRAGAIGKPKALPKISDGDTPFALPNGWRWVRLGDVSYKITDGTHRTPTYVLTGVPFVSVKDFSGGALDFSNTRFISPEEHAELYKRCDPRRGDILIGRIGTLGKAVVVETDQEFSLFVSVGLIRLASEFVSPAFVRHALNSPHINDEFQRIKVGGATHTNKLNLGDLHTILLPLPPLAEQHRIVTRVNEIMALCDRLEAQLTHTRDRAAQLATAVVQHLTAA